MLAYLTLTSGSRSGSNYLLDPKIQNQIGRGLDCQIILTDPLSSRVHAVVWFDEDGWWARDAGSRNGTFLNGQKIDEVRLVDGCLLKIGDAEFSFRMDDRRPDSADTALSEPTETIIIDTPMSGSDTSSFAAASFDEKGQARDLIDIYQLSILLLGCTDQEQVITTSLEVIRERSGASLAAFLSVDDAGQLRPKRILPDAAAKKLALSATLTDMVTRQRRGVWTSRVSTGNISDSMRHFADAICIPAIRDNTMLGALHLYMERGRFKQSDFEVAMSVANMLAIALSKARQLAAIQADNARLAAQSASSSELLGESPAMLDLKNKLRKIAKAPGAVLVRGESGCGKELVARDLHRASPRCDRPMLSVNCAAIPRDLMESQLFGHKKGAFTGADSDRVGWFQQADSGTLFLDEVGEMTLDGQAKLLRILEGHPFLPVGGQTEISVDVRVIAATNRDLREFVREGRFREDLYYRLGVFELYIPPLRDRGTDVELLLMHFFEHFKKQHGRPDLVLLPSARERLLAYNWPGNVRQLRNVIDSAVVLADGNQIRPEDLGLRDTSDELESLRIDFWERKLIKQAIERTGGNIPDAARLLGIGRATLYRKVEDYGMK
ncbi:MAG: sigma 54-interacting transcriptional regulator [Planctomycetaceae bacterium]|nr:sigma 54-interacting transcriptional regulator [Planctomycetales bacterium]MCB9921178.1 sigma 54-interacting transcriptional regulator [Planctomycetaceae bacterium]